MKNSSLLWAIAPYWEQPNAKSETIPDLVQGMLKGNVDIKRSAIEPCSLAAVPLGQSNYSYVVGKTAVIPVHGPIRNRLGYSFSYQELQRDLAEAVGSEDVEVIFLDIESPGGMVAGIDEGFSAIIDAKQKKPVYAHIGAIGASAAYALASAADVVSASRTSIVGSVGAIISYTDATGILEHFGAKTVSVVADQSPNKRHEVGSKEHIAELKPIVNDGAELFLEMLQQGRGVSREFIMKNYGQGSIFPAPEALNRKMIDSIATTSEALQNASSRESVEAVVPRRAEAPLLDFAESKEEELLKAADDEVLNQLNSMLDDLSSLDHSIVSETDGGKILGEEARSLLGLSQSSAIAEKLFVSPTAHEDPVESSTEYQPDINVEGSTSEKGEAVMKTPAQIVRGLREQIATLAGQINTIKDNAARRENHHFTDAEMAEIKTLNAKIDGIKEQISAYGTADDIAEQSEELIPARASGEPLNHEGRLQLGENARAPSFLSGPDAEGWSPMESAGYSNGSLGMGEMCRDIIEARVTGRRSERLTTLSNNGHEGEKGGFFLPNAIQKPLRDSSMNQLALLDLCDTDEDIDDYSFEIPVDDTQPWYTNRGLQARNAPEGATAGESELSLDKRRLELGKVQIMVKVTDRLMKTVSALGRVVQNKAAKALAWKISQQIAYGNGVNQAYGFMNSGALVTVAAEASQTADTIVAENIAKMIAANSSSESAFDNLIFLIHPGLVDQAHLLEVQKTSEVLTIAQGGEAGFARARPPRTLAGVPYRTHQICQQPGDLGDIMLVDLKEYYAPIFRGGIELKISEEAGFTEDEIYLKFTIHVGGIPYLNAPILAKNGSFQQSPFVTLAAR